MPVSAGAPARVVMIGDTSHDLRMAANAGVAAVAVTYGAHSPEELREGAPLAVVNSVTELRDWLLPRVVAPAQI